MITFIKQKLIHKKWLNLCVAIGLTLFISIIISTTLYQSIALNKMLKEKCNNYIATENAYPMISQLVEEEYIDTGTLSEQFDSRTKFFERITKEIYLLPIKEQFNLVQLPSTVISSSYRTDDEKSLTFLVPTVLSGLEDHIEIIKGEMYSDSKRNGYYECVVPERVLVENNLSIGEILQLSNYHLKDGSPFIVKLVGVFREKESNDIFWTTAPSELQKELFLSPQGMDELSYQVIEDQLVITTKGNYLLDYSKLTGEEAISLLERLQNSKGNFPQLREYSNPGQLILQEFLRDAKKVNATMWILQLPIFVLLLAFIYMVSKQLFDLEENEISMLKSRGVSRGEIVSIYTIQGTILTVISAIVAIPIGYIICKILGCANAFMSFVQMESYPITLKMTLLWNVLLGCTICIIFMTIPTVSLSKFSIVEAKNKKKRKETTIWKRYYIDVLLLVLSLYMLYNFNEQKDVIAMKVLAGASLDPILFLSSSLFMLGVGLIGLRIMHLGIRAIYFLGRKRWNPVFYTSFLQIIRTEKKQTFISIFLIFTIAMGIFNANIARTIKQSDEERTYYDLGTDIVFRESWQSNQAEANKFNTKLIYSEPDYNRYQELKTQVDSITRVMRQDNLKVYYNGVQINDKIELMGIHTKEFGETAWMKDELMNPHWYTYLNSLGKTQNGILISQNLADKYGLKTGDQLKYSRIDEKEKIYGTLTSTIVGIVPIWPGFQQYHEIIQENTGELVREESYLIVGNMQQIINEMGIVPYEIWVKNFGDNSNSTIVEEFLEANHISIEKYNNAQQDIMIHNQQATVQVTYGLLTLSFIISLVLCTIGFLIYWIMSIKQRELLLGIYRAMGMSMKQIIGMLLNEHVFSSLFSILIGILVGNLSSYFYVPLITIAYAPEKHVLPYTMASDFTDKIRIAIAMLFMLITCLYAIGNVVSKMKIAQALKLGED